MGEYEPITKGLRDYVTLLHDEGSAAKARLDEMCDNIDAIHRLLEAENERLRVELDRVLSEKDDAAPEKPRTIGKLQAEVTVTSHLDFEGLARDLEEAARAVRSVGGDDWIKLPVDADGVPICVGDMLAEGEASPERVKSLMLDCDGWSVNFGLGWCVMRYHKWHHAKPDTWESIIEDAMQAYGNITENMGPLVARCKALCERTREGE